jgi:hypothetical protein
VKGKQMPAVKLDPKSLAKFAAVVKANNATFIKLTLPQQRVKIAEDVIAQIRSRKLVAKSRNGYLNLPDAVEGQIEELINPQDEDDKADMLMEFENGGRYEHLKHLLKPEAFEEVPKCELPDLSAITLQSKCIVCGIGSMFVSTVEKMDKLKITDSYGAEPDIRDRDTQVKYMRKWFSESQLRLIENYFEQFGIGSFWEDSKIKSQSSDNKRLIMIMENIISNKGKFDPTKGKHADVESE